MMSSLGGGGAEVGAAVGAAVGADVGAAVGAEVGAAVASGPGLLGDFGFELGAWRLGAGSAGALPSTTTLGAVEGAGTEGSVASRLEPDGCLAPPSSPPMEATA
jgi:hypothetical protein